MTSPRSSQHEMVMPSKMNRFGHERLGFTRHMLGLTVMVWVALSGPVLLAAPRLPGYERFFTEQTPPTIEAGRVLMSELHCHVCHEGAEQVILPLKPKQAPSLTEIAQRVRLDWIRTLLMNPEQAKLGITMPDVLSQTAEERQMQIEALLHFFATTGSLRESHPDRQAQERGSQLVVHAGCLACHDPPHQATTLPTSTSWPDLKSKYSFPSLADFLKDPLKTRPSARMPALQLTDEEARAVAHYLLKDLQVPPNLHYEVYYGDWDTLPDFTQIKPVHTGTCAGFDLSVAQRNHSFAIRFRGYWHVKQSAQHIFALASDDGSRLLVDGQVIVSNDGIHPRQEVIDRHSFTAGWHEVVVEYFQGHGEWNLDVDVMGAGLRKQPLSALLSLEPNTQTNAAAFVPNAELAARGQAYFEQVGCARCHQLVLKDQPLVSRGTPAPSWNECRPDHGCLSTNPPTQAPRYRLTEHQRQSLNLVLVAKQTLPPLTDEQLVHHTLLVWNCYACHSRGERGGIEPARDTWFTTRQPEMGEEGRVPPSLTGIGDKLQAGWLDHLWEQGARDRQQYMRVRMPKFGRTQIGHLTPLLAKLDARSEMFTLPVFDEPDYRVKADARYLVGGQALSCIKCHDFGPYPAQGIRAINLLSMPQRLRPEWFVRYLRDPQEYRPGTRMPAPWPFGQATIREVLHGQVDAQIWAIWVYLSDGERAALPHGLLREPIELIPGDEPIVYRNLVEGAGPRALALGFPKKVHAAWDAAQFRLALLWHGAFLEVSKHWTARGAGYISPLGDDVLTFPQGPELTVLDSLEAPWPTQIPARLNAHFLGYTIHPAERVEIEYQMGRWKVRDAWQPGDQAQQRYPGMKRHILLVNTAPDSEVPSSPHQLEVWRVVQSRHLQALSERTWQVDGSWHVQIESSSRPYLHQQGDTQELRISLPPDRTRHEIRLDYIW
ncbi:MAG: hypothetical protein KatS3mg113_0978 [Planctomycetaceae bacterium]|nr:MAG: hypothetical protein KatS3mg113_0978 [Planctomycetaceae bacterium]